MADAVQKPVKKASKPKKPSSHPKYSEMIRAAVSSLKERGGSSRQAILRYILANFNVGKDEKSVNTHLKLALKSGVKKGALKQAKGTGASGSFRLGSAVEKPKKRVAKKSPKKAKAAKPKAAKPKAKSPAKKAAKKPAAKKSPKKKAAAKKPKSPAKKPVVKKAKSPKKVAAKKSKARPAKRASPKKK